MSWSRLLGSAAMAAGLAAAGVTGLTAAEIQELEISVMGSPSSVNAWTFVQKPFFEGTLPEASGGKITVAAVPHNEAGINMLEAVRMASDGVVNIAHGAFGHIAGDDPRFAAIDLPGIGVTVEEARAAAEAYKPIVAEVLAEKENLKLLSVQPNSMQVILCKGQITGLDYFEGKKVRTWNKAMADYMEALGATTVNIPWEEALPALQRGVADCGITSPANANTARWWEVLDSLMVIPLGGWAIGFFGADLDWWNGLNADTQEFLLTEFADLEDRQWEQAAYDLEDGVDCNTGEGDCEYGVPAEPGKEMTAVYPDEQDMELHHRILRESVLQSWAESCGAECVEQWNATVGEVVGIEAPTP